MDDHVFPLAADYFKSSSYPRRLDRTLRVHVTNTVPLGVLVQRSNDRGPQDDNEGINEAWSVGDQLQEYVSETFSVPVNSATLSKESEFFQGLLGSHGFREASSFVVDIYITSKEKEVFQHLLQCMCTGDITSLTDVEQILTLWGLADRFMSRRCCSHCIRKLKNAALSLDQCIRIIDIHGASPVCETRKLLQICVRELIDRFKALSFTKPQNEEDEILLAELMSLPPSSLEALLASDFLPVEREEVAFYAMIVWVKQNASSREEEQELITRMAPHIRYPFMKADVLVTLTELPELQNPTCQQFLVEGLKFRSASHEMRMRFRSRDARHRRFVQRVAYNRPLQVLVVELPRKQATAHFSAATKELENMKPGFFVEYETFVLSGSRFSFRITQTMVGNNTSRKRIGLQMMLINSLSERVLCDLQVFVWSQSEMAFCCRFRSWHAFEANNPILSCTDLLGRDWKAFRHPVDGKIYISTELLIRI